MVYEGKNYAWKLEQILTSLNKNIREQDKKRATDFKVNAKNGGFIVHDEYSIFFIPVDEIYDIVGEPKKMGINLGVNSGTYIHEKIFSCISARHICVNVKDREKEDENLLIIWNTHQNREHRNFSCTGEITYGHLEGNDIGVAFCDGGFYCPLD